MYKGALFMIPRGSGFNQTGTKDITVMGAAAKRPLPALSRLSGNCLPRRSFPGRIARRLCSGFIAKELLYIESLLDRQSWSAGLTIASGLGGD